MAEKPKQESAESLARKSLRERLVISALSGAAVPQFDRLLQIAERAVQIADAAIEVLGRPKA